MVLDILESQLDEDTIAEWDNEFLNELRLVVRAFDFINSDEYCYYLKEHKEIEDIAMNWLKLNYRRLCA